MDEEAAVQYVFGLQTAEQRRAATAVPRPKLLAAVRALSSCQRCGFVEQVLAAFNPELGAFPGLGGAPTPLSVALSCARTEEAGTQSQQCANVRDAPTGLHNAPGRAGTSQGPTPSQSCVAGGLLSPAQLLALVSGGNNNGSAEMVSLLQFAWKDREHPDSGDAGGSADTGVSAAGGGRGSIALSETLLGKPRLLQRFLQESLITMQALAEEVGDCARHVGYPGPAELASTLARLETQRSHTLERLAAWGVLRAPAPPAKGQTPGEAQAQGRGVVQDLAAQQRTTDAPDVPVSAQLPLQQPLVQEGGPLTALSPSPLGRAQPAQQQMQRRLHGRLRASRDAADVGAGESAMVAAADDADEDAQLALAIRLSLQDAAGIPLADAAAGSGARRDSLDCSNNLPGNELPSAVTSAAAAAAAAAEPPGTVACATGMPGHQGLRGATASAGTPRRPQRTPPRPTGGQPRVDGRGPEQESPARALGSWPERSPGRSPIGAAIGAPGRPTAPPESPGASLQGLAALGLVDDFQPPSLQHPRPAPSPQPPQNASPSPPPSTAPATERPHEPSATASAPPGSAQQPSTHAGPQPARAASPSGSVGGHAAGPRLSVAAAVAAAAGLEDATVLVDAAAVAALPQGLRERVEHLVSQLVQVQQRRGRLEHACQHGIVAGGRKLLLILLQLMWATLRRAAATATAAGSTTPVSDASGVAADSTGPVPAPGVSGGAAATLPGSGAAEGTQAGRPPRRRRARYEGLLADLAAGLEEDDMYMEILGPELDLAWASGSDNLGSDAEPDGRGSAPSPSVAVAAGSAAQSPGLLSPPPGQPGGLGRVRNLAGRGRRTMQEPVSVGDLGGGGNADGAGVTARVAGLAPGMSTAIAPLHDGSSNSGRDGEGDDSGDWLREVVTPGGTGTASGLAGRSAAPSLPPLQAESPTARGPRRRGPPLPSLEEKHEQAVLVATEDPLGRQSSSQARSGVGTARRRRMSEKDAAAAAGTEEASEDGDCWDAARSSTVRLPAAALRSSQQAAWHEMRQRMDSANTVSASASYQRLAGGLGTWPGPASAGSFWGGERERSRWAQLERDAGSAGQCGADCLAVRAEQAEQLQILQGQLERCQTSQAQLQGEVGRLLDMMAESRRVQELASSSLRRELAQWQGDLTALQGLGADELADLAGRMEAALSRVRAAHLQAAAERDLMCPVCWERRKGLVFGCGHQTCCTCGEKLTMCPICRELITIRIRVYG